MCFLLSRWNGRRYTPNSNRAAKAKRHIYRTWATHHCSYHYDTTHNITGQPTLKVTVAICSNQLTKQPPANKPYRITDVPCSTLSSEILLVYRKYMLGNFTVWELTFLYTHFLKYLTVTSVSNPFFVSFFAWQKSKTYKTRHLHFHMKRIPGNSRHHGFQRYDAWPSFFGYQNCYQRSGGNTRKRI